MCDSVQYTKQMYALINKTNLHIIFDINKQNQLCAKLNKHVQYTKKNAHNTFMQNYLCKTVNNTLCSNQQSFATMCNTVHNKNLNKTVQKYVQ